MARRFAPHFSNGIDVSVAVQQRCAGVPEGIAPHDELFISQS
jgi:hypothetical protein